jgi:membrane-associated protease RseP (regulator of RpoE activity)
VGEPAKPRARRRGPALNAVLFAATVGTVFLAGATFLPAETVADAVRNGLEFSAALLGILVCHEAGHYFAARRRRIDASLPYFIPMPPFLSPFGTMGAVILMRGRIRSRDALMEVGAAGPLAGMAVAVPLLFVGLSQCRVGPIPAEGFIEGQSLLYLLAKRLVLGPIPDGYDVYINDSPLAWAAWIGTLVTALNLLPIGQLDGGHVLCALIGDAHARASKWFVRALFALGAAVGVGLGTSASSAGLGGVDLLVAALPGAQWFVAGGLLALLHRRRGFGHPRPDADGLALSPTHRAAGIACAVLFVLTFMPIVMRPII